MKSSSDDEIRSCERVKFASTASEEKEFFKSESRHAPAAALRCKAALRCGSEIHPFGWVKSSFDDEIRSYERVKFASTASEEKEFF